MAQESARIGAVKVRVPYSNLGIQTVTLILTIPTPNIIPIDIVIRIPIPIRILQAGSLD